MKSRYNLKSAIAISAIVFSASVFPVSSVTANTGFYQVANVNQNDSLNMRSGAGTTYPVIGSIPSNGRTIMATGRTQQVGNSNWAEVVWLGQFGWVNKHFLTTGYQQQAPQAPVQQVDYNQQNANGHTHPANRCTRSITHTHPNGANSHQHNYSCQPNQQNTANQQSQPQRPVNNANTHRHPANRCTNSITHTHPNGAGQHNHRYSCTQMMARPKYQPQPKYTNY